MINLAQGLLLALASKFLGTAISGDEVNFQMKFNTFGKRVGWWLILLVVACASITSTVVLYRFLPIQNSDRTSSQTKEATESTIAVNAVAALGDLEPQGEVITLSAPNTTQGSRVDQLLVERGDSVKAGQVIAILDSRDRLSAALKKAQKQVLVSQARLAQVKAGAKQGEIDARKADIGNILAERRGQIATQQATIQRLEAELQGEKQAQAATIERLEAELQNAKTDCDRYERLYFEGAVTEIERDRKCLEQKTATERVNEASATLNRIVNSRREQIAEAKATKQRTIDTLQQQLAEAKATLEQTAEVRPVDVAIASSELENAKASVQQAQAELDLAYVRSPSSGQILKINARPGELASEKGIVALGQTQQMYVKAEVYETDIGKVRVGQRAIITSNGFSAKLHGTVDEIGLEIGKKDVLGTDPVADVDARVVEVRIRLDLADSKLVAGLTNLKVKSIIDTSSVR
nr:ABC exporter membrane fusion protein [Hassalia byssoidea]